MLRIVLLASLLLVAGCQAARDRPPSDADPEPEPSVDAPECDDWAWVRGAELSSIHGTSPSAVFAAGRQGTLVQWTGSGWRDHDLGTREDLGPVWALGDDAVWVAGGDRLWSWDGARWSVVREGFTVRHLAGTARDDLWISDGARIERFDGARWEDRSPPGPLGHVSMLVRAPGEAWILQHEGRSLQAWRSAGAGWTQVGELQDQYWATLALERGEVVVVDRRQVLRFEAGAWRPAPREALDAARWPEADGAPAPGDDTWILLGNASGLVTMSSRVGCADAVLRLGAESFCLADGGRVLHHDGASAPRSIRLAAPPRDERWGALPPALWAGEHRTWGTAPDDLLRVRAGESTASGPGADTLEHFDGAGWRALATGWFSDLDGTGPRDAWIVGDPVLRWDGAAVRAVELPAALGEVRLARVHAVSPEVAWFVGWVDGRSAVLRHDGEWSVVLAPAASDERPVLELDDVIETTDGTIWVVGVEREHARAPGPGLLLRFHGAAWSRESLPEVWGYGSLATDGERVWASAYAAHDAISPRPDGGRLHGRFDVVRTFVQGALWAGDGVLFETRRAQAAHCTPRPAR